MKTIKVVSAKEFKRVERIARAAAIQASNHDPEHHREIGLIRRQLERLAEFVGYELPQYRQVRKGKPIRRNDSRKLIIK